MDSSVKISGAEIKRRRIAAGLSQAELAALIGGVVQSTISRGEKNDFSDWSDEALGRLYKALKIDPKIDFAVMIWGICSHFVCSLAYWDMTDGKIRAIPFAQKCQENTPYKKCVHCQKDLIFKCQNCKAAVVPGQSGCTCGVVYCSDPTEEFDDKVEKHNAKRQQLLEIRAYFEKNS